MPPVPPPALSLAFWVLGSSKLNSRSFCQMWRLIFQRQSGWYLIVCFPWSTAPFFIRPKPVESSLMRKKSALWAFFFLSDQLELTSLFSSIRLWLGQCPKYSLENRACSKAKARKKSCLISEGIPSRDSQAGSQKVSYFLRDFRL